MRNLGEVLTYFPMNIFQRIMQEADKNNRIYEELQEIRVRVNKNIILKLRREDIVLDYITTSNEILQTVERLCENSIYAYKNQICEGFITVKGGHRVGLTGSCVIEDGKIINIKYISSLNFRVAREIIDCSNQIIGQIVDIQNRTILNSIIVAPPGKGKTTMLRDAIRKISNGIPELELPGKTCGIVDERGEIAACFRGTPQNDVGIRTDVIENVSKDKGIHMLIRSMAPDIIACDEIGSKEDIDAIEYALYSGVKGIFTMHGKSVEDMKNNKEIYRLIEKREIEKVIFL